jgi:uncharacterized protein (DUF58 family)
MLREFHYRIRWRSRSPYPGYHPSTQAGAGFELRGHAPLQSYPDPRRLDLHASLRDPFEQWLVRTYRQRSSIPVYLLADLSASMGFLGQRRKLDVVADLAASLGYSAFRTGDPFGFVGCDTQVRREWLLAPTRVRGAGPGLAQRLRAFEPQGRGCAGLLEAPSWLGRQRSLVFLASDFHFSLQLLERLLATLSRHEVVPVVVWDRAELEHTARFGIAVLQDSESGARRVLLLRPALRRRIAQAFEQRRKALTKVFLAHGSPPLFLLDGFQAERFTEYFLDYGLGPGVQNTENHGVHGVHGGPGER